MNSILSKDSIPNDIGDIFFNIQKLFDKFKAPLIMLLSLYEINSVLSLNKLESELIKDLVFNICPLMSIFVIFVNSNFSISNKVLIEDIISEYI
jgi:hypothetical protein